VFELEEKGNIQSYFYIDRFMSLGRQTTYDEKKEIKTGPTTGSSYLRETSSISRGKKPP